MKQIPIRVRGNGFHGSFVKPEAQAGFVRRTHAALRDAVRFRILRSTRHVGRPFRFLSCTWDIRQAPWVEADNGDTLLVFQAPSLHAAAPRLFEQGSLFDEDHLEPDWTAFDLLGQVIAVVSKVDADELTMDIGMLSTLGGLGRGLGREMEAASFPFSQSQEGTAVIDQRLAARVQTAMARTPEPRLVRAVGKLDMLRMSDHLFQLVMDGGIRVSGVWPADKAPLKYLLGEQVCMEGKGSFRPNGSLASIEGTAVRLADLTDAPFRKAPQASGAHLALAAAATSGKGFAAIVGKWPGEETDEDIRSWLRETS